MSREDERRAAVKDGAYDDLPKDQQPVWYASRRAAFLAAKRGKTEKAAP